MIYQPGTWKHTSPDSEGWHEVITPENSQCQEVRIYRLNLKKGSSFEIKKELELSGVIISGKVAAGQETLGQFDSFYLPGNASLTVTALEDAVIYIGGAVSDAPGEVYFMHFDRELPLGDIHQIHGAPPYDREVFFTLPPQVPASRLITGVTWSRNGTWTSWPPHQHEKDLEEAYFYFGPQKPQFGMHLSFLESGKPDAVHTVTAGDCVEAPVGYHPTVAAPGDVNAYFWVLAARRPSSRRYDLAVEDPCYAAL